MTKFPVKVCIALLAVLVGLIGVIVLLVPSLSQEGNVVRKYVAAINSLDTQKMQACMADPSDLTEALASYGVDNAQLEKAAQEANVSSEAIKRWMLLECSELDLSLPEDARGIEKIEMVGCTSFSDEAIFLQSDGVSMALLKVDYLTGDEEVPQKTIYLHSSVSFTMGMSGYSIR